MLPRRRAGAPIGARQSVWQRRLTLLRFPLRSDRSACRRRWRLPRRRPLLIGRIRRTTPGAQCSVTCRDVFDGAGLGTPRVSSLCCRHDASAYGDASHERRPGAAGTMIVPAQACCGVNILLGSVKGTLADALQQPYRAAICAERSPWKHADCGRRRHSTRLGDKGSASRPVSRGPH